MSTPFFSDTVGGTVVDVPSDSNRIWLLRLVNTTAAAAYLQIFNRPASLVTLGTTVASWVIRLGANESATIPIPDAVTLGVFPSTGTVAPPARMSVAGTTTPGGLTAAIISVAMATA